MSVASSTFKFYNTNKDCNNPHPYTEFSKRRSNLHFFLLIFITSTSRLTNAWYYSITFYGLQVVTPLLELPCDLLVRLFSDFIVATLTVGHTVIYAKIITSAEVVALSVKVVGCFDLC